MKTMKDMDFKEVERKLVEDIRRVAGDRGVTVGLSGGIDSSLAVVLAVKALGCEKVKAVVLVNSKFSKEVGIDVARKFALENGILTQEFDIGEIRERVVSETNLDTNDEIKRATLDVRLCDLFLRTVSTLEDRIYLGTINSTERLCGWFPKGSLVGDFDLLGGLLKEQIKELARLNGLGHLVEAVSEDAKDICSGCGFLPDFEGIPFEAMDRVLFAVETFSAEELDKWLQECDIPSWMSERILKRVRQVKHKQELFPPFTRVNVQGAAA
ncbi:NAD(+) synthase [Candidatus Pacearchaeota archaeon]|nr:NAD(+) synthase [Candidatus Pacearchaeota archaeon]